MNKIETKECIICEIIYPYKTEAGKSSGRSIRNYRGKNSFTCSKKCSKVYNRIYHKVSELYSQKLKREKNKQ